MFAAVFLVARRFRARGAGSRGRWIRGIAENKLRGSRRRGDVSFSLTRHGQNVFQHVTAAIGHRGDLVSGLGQTFNQHFAIALDGKLLTVPQIDFKTYPDGIPAGQGADIVGAFTTQGARDLAAILRFGPLPLPLTAH